MTSYESLLILVPLLTGMIQVGVLLYGVRVLRRCGGW